MHREVFIEKLTEVQQTVEQLLAQLQASEHDKFAAHLYRSRREYRSVCQRAGKSGKQIERCVISTFQVAGSIGFKGDFRQWEQVVAGWRLIIGLHSRSKSRSGGSSRRLQKS